MQKNYKVTIIIPVYNVEPYLEECLDSVLNQTLEEIEIICINDGSTDDSLHILKSYACKDRRIAIYNQRNQGLSIARNVGLEHARGEYIYFLDSDDIIDTNALMILYEQASRDDLDILYFDGISFYENEIIEAQFPEKRIVERSLKLEGVYSGLDLLQKLDATNGYKSMVWLQLIRREFLIQNNFKFKKRMLHEDLLFSLETILQAKQVGFHPSSLHLYRIREDSITTQQKRFENFYGFFISCVIINMVLEEQSLVDEIKKRGIIILDTYMKEAIWIFDRLGESEKEKIYDMPEEEQFYFCQYILPECQSFHYLPGEITALKVEIAHLWKQDEIPPMSKAQSILGEKKYDEMKITSRAEYLRQELEIRKECVRMSREQIEKLKSVEKLLLETECQCKTKINEVAKLQQELNIASKEIQHLKNSISFRIGRMITFLPRKVRGGIKCCKEHGISYTCKLFLHKIARRFNP